MSGQGAARGGGGGRGGRDKGMKRACFAFAAGGRAENKWVSDSVR